jgi:hypothetical protein
MTGSRKWLTRMKLVACAILAGCAGGANRQAPAPLVRTSVADAGSQLGGSGFEPGGSNYHYWYIAPTYWTVENPGLELVRPGRVQMAIGNFHTWRSQPGQSGRHPVELQLEEMYRNGQRKISLPIHFIREQDHCEFLSRKECDSGEVDYDGDETSGISVRVTTANPEQWTFSPQVLENLKALLGVIARTGFNEVQIRFLTHSHAINPILCAASYDPRTPEGLWTLERSVMDTTNRVLQGSGVKVMYDLGAEFAGYQRDTRNSDLLSCGDGRVRTAMRYLWRSYACRASEGGWPHTNWSSDSALAHTIGFTFAGRVRRKGPNEDHNQIIYDQVTDVYDRALMVDTADARAGYVCGGPRRPAVLAFDIYTVGGSDQWGLGRCKGPCLERELFTEIGRQLARLGNFYQPIALWEVPYNSDLLLKALTYASSELCLNIRTVMQWPAYWDGASEPRLGVPARLIHFNVPTTPQYIYDLPRCRTG